MVENRLPVGILMIKTTSKLYLLIMPSWYWTVRVTDDYHGGSRTWQPYALAVRVNVNDLSPDPSFAPEVNIDPPIPQIGDP